jgi:hypothetical protein
MSSGFFCWKAKTISHSFHGTKGSNSDVSNNILASQQYQEPATNNVKNQPPNQWLPTNYFLSPPINSSES